MKDNSSLSNSVAHGVVWMLAMRMSLRVLGLVSTVVLARLLTPVDFGIVAIAMSIFALLHLIRDFGFDTVIIQMHEPRKEHYDTAWTFNLLFGVSLSIILILSAGYIAMLYETPELEYLIWAIASLFIIGGLESVGTLDFRKHLTFEKEFWLKIVPKLIGVPCTLLLAYGLRNYWALTIGTIITQLSVLILGYRMHLYRPRFNLSAARELFNFSKWLMMNNFVQFMNNRSPELIIGKMLNPQAAGLFTVSNEIGMMVTTEMSAAVSRASYPGYAKIAKQKDNLKNLYLNVLGSASLILFPVAFGFYSVADLIVPVFLGNQWLATVPMMKLIAIGGLLLALNSNAGYVFMAIGNPRLSTFLGATRFLIFIPSLLYFLTKYDIEGAAWTVFYTTIIMFFVTSAVVIRVLSIRLLDLVNAYYRPLISSVLMSIVIAQSSSWIRTITSSDYMQLLIKVMIGVLLYGICVLLLWYTTSNRDGPENKVISLIMNRFNRNRRI